MRPVRCSMWGTFPSCSAGTARFCSATSWHCGGADVMGCCSSTATPTSASQTPSTMVRPLRWIWRLATGRGLVSSPTSRVAVRWCWTKTSCSSRGSRELLAWGGAPTTHAGAALNVGLRGDTRLRRVGARDRPRRWRRPATGAATRARRGPQLHRPRQAAVPDQGPPGDALRVRPVVPRRREPARRRHPRPAEGGHHALRRRVVPEPGSMPSNAGSPPARRPDRTPAIHDPKLWAGATPHQGRPPRDGAVAPASFGARRGRHADRACSPLDGSQP